MDTWCCCDRFYVCSHRIVYSVGANIFFLQEHVCKIRVCDYAVYSGHCYFFHGFIHNRFIIYTKMAFILKSWG
jgi:hypothetical protein